MKVHKYQIITYRSIIDSTHGMGERQTRLYIPNQGVFAFRNRKHIDFFADSPEAIDKAKKCISGKSNTKLRVNYFGQIELPNDLIDKAISAGKTLNQAATSFQESAKTLIELVEE